MLFLAFNNSPKSVVNKKNWARFGNELKDKELITLLAYDMCFYIKCFGAIHIDTIDKMFEIDLKNFGIPKNERQKYKDKILEMLEQNFNIKITKFEQNINYEEDVDFLKKYKKIRKEFFGK